MTRYIVTVAIEVIANDKEDAKDKIDRVIYSYVLPKGYVGHMVVGVRERD